MASEWKIRTAQSEDLNFIYATWARSYRYSHISKCCRTSLFYKEYNQVIDRILEQDDTEVLVACKEDEPFVIVGYIIYQPESLHYVYTKELFFRLGVAKSLFEEAQLRSGQFKQFTHRTQMVEPMLIRRQDLIYNPFYLFKKGAHAWQTQSNNLPLQV